MWFNKRLKEVNIKITYYGPGMAGKYTNIKYIFDITKPELKGDLCFSRKIDHIMHCNIVGKELFKETSYKVRLHLETIPGACFYDSSKKHTLRGVDGIVFVADSQIERISANKESLAGLKKYLVDLGYDIVKVPYVLQLNKCDLLKREVYSQTISLLKKELTFKDEPIVEAVAYKGIGVLNSLEILINVLNEKLKTNCF